MPFDPNDPEYQLWRPDEAPTEEQLEEAAQDGGWWDLDKKQRELTKAEKEFKEAIDSHRRLYEVATSGQQRNEARRLIRETEQQYLKKIHEIEFRYLIKQQEIIDGWSRKPSETPEGQS